MRRALGLDVGTKTIGIAATDALGWMAHPVCTVSRTGVERDSASIAKIAAERRSELIVVGLPLELDGTETRSAHLARQIGERVGTLTGLPVEYVDERYTSVDAERRLIQAGVSRERRKEIIDQEAAIGILGSWLALEKERLGGPESS
ncbi:MAG: Holliday junction resolvase RuvX [Deltaproteobacteria bacterium]|nr:Holliday junction resolvase RuvX [Deltaproteobacteria bacterium]